MNELLRPSPEVADALAAGRPVVALESTLITHGLPAPRNLEAATAAELAVRDGGAVPATVAIRDGRILVGMTADELADLVAAIGTWKVTRQNLAASLARPGWSGTTVSATMIAAHLAGIEVFATGGIGGVHRGGHDSLDISADLDELSRTPVAVVSAGPKSILDVPRTMEVLETRGVPVVGWCTDELAGFTSVSAGVSVPARVDSAAAAAELVARHWALGLGSGVLFAVPLAAELALPSDVARSAIERAVAEAEGAGIRGPAATPWILGRMAELTGGLSIEANLALIVRNAAVAASIAAELRLHGRPVG